MNTVISRRPTPFVYTKWIVEQKSGTCIPEYSITINGGAGVTGGSAAAVGLADKNIPLLTPEGVATIVDDKRLELLMGVPKFRSDIERGLIRVIKGKSITDQDKLDNEADKHMADKDDIVGRQLTKDDLEDAGAIEQKDGSWDVSDADTRDASEIRKTSSRRRKRR